MEAIAHNADTLPIGTRVDATTYTGHHGTIIGVDSVQPAYRHGVTGDPMPAEVWYSVRLDNGSRNVLDASRFRVIAGFDCATCRTTQDDNGREYRPDLDVPHVHCKRCDAAVLDRQTHCAWCGEHRSAREPMPGTFGAWLGGRTAEHVPYRRETDPPSADPFTTPERRVAPSLGDPRPMADRIGASTSSVPLRDLYRRMMTTPSGQPRDAEHGPGPSGKFRALWAAIGGTDGRADVLAQVTGGEPAMSALAECYPETLQSLATDLAHHGQTVADVLRIEHVRPGGRRIVVYTSDGCAYRAYALDGEGSCGTCSGRGTDPHEPGLPCAVCEGSCEPSDVRLDDREADHA